MIERSLSEILMQSTTICRSVAGGRGLRIQTSQTAKKPPYWQDSRLYLRDVAIDRHAFGIDGIPEEVY